MEYEKIYEVVKKLVGDINPVGESDYDEKVFENLKTELVLVEMLLEDIKDVSRLSSKEEYSMFICGQFADKMIETYRNILGKDTKNLLCHKDGEQALTHRLHIGVATTDKNAAEKFMIDNFNVPDNKKYSNSSIIYEYKNGDVVEWVAPIEYNRAKKVDKMYIQYSLRTEGKICDMLRNSSINNPEYIDVN